MNEHEENLRDLYAGLAMIGLLMKSWPFEKIGELAFDVANDLLNERRKRQANENAQ